MVCDHLAPLSLGAIRGPESTRGKVRGRARVGRRGAPAEKMLLHRIRVGRRAAGAPICWEASRGRRAGRSAADTNSVEKHFFSRRSAPADARPAPDLPAGGLRAPNSAK